MLVPSSECARQQLGQQSVVQPLEGKELLKYICIRFDLGLSASPRIAFPEVA